MILAGVLKIMIKYKRFISSLPATYSEIERVSRVINDHPFPAAPLLPTLHSLLQPALLSNTSFVESVLGRLFSGHANGLKALELFRFALSQQPQASISTGAFEKTLHILTRMRDFDKAWELMLETHRRHPSFITLKSLSIFFSKYAKFQSFDATLDAFDRLEKVLDGRRFGANEFNVLQAFCTQRQMKEACAVFRKLHSRFSVNPKTMKILLLGFRESGNVTAVEVLYHELVRRGFKPNVITYNIMIDAYCKKGCFSDALRVLDEMEAGKLLPTLETMTTLIHGAGIVRNPIQARRLFDQISERKLRADVGAYNALICSCVRAGDLNAGIELFGKMEENGIEHDNMTYHTMFLGLKKFDTLEGVCKLCKRMTKKNFVPKMRTVVMLMKFFCENGRPDLGLELWEYMTDKGCCPHMHALNLLVTALCCRGRLEEAYHCVRQVVERGRHPCEVGVRVLEGFLDRTGNVEKLHDLDRMMKRLQTVLSPSKRHNLSLHD